MSGDVFQASRSERAVGYVAIAWCLSLAAVSVWQLVTELPTGTQIAAYASGLAAMVVVVLLLKVEGALVVFAAVTPLQRRVPAGVLATCLWGAFALLALYSAGNLVITAGTVTGLFAPSAAWTAAGGVTPKAVLYVAFFLVGAAIFGVLAVSFQRRRRPGWRVVLVGAICAPVVLALLLAVAPALLGRLGLLPT
jgi:hypothetical protein